MDADYVDQLVQRGLISDDVAARMMTHQAEQPNPVTPIIQRARDFLTSGDFNPVHNPGTEPKDYLRELARDPAIRAKAIEQASQFNFGGMARPSFWAKTPAKAVRADEMLKQGHSIQTIADDLGEAASSVHSYFKQSGQKTAAAENPSILGSWTPEREAGLIEDYTKGMSQPALAKKYELSPGTIHSKLMNLSDRGKVDYVKRPPTFRESPDKQSLLKQRLAERRSQGEIARDPGLGVSDPSTISKWVRILKGRGEAQSYAPQGGYGLTPAGRTPTLWKGKAQVGPAPELDEDMAKTLAKYLKFGT